MKRTFLIIMCALLSITTWTPQYKDITTRYDFDLNGSQNKLFISGHRGRHPNEYHQWILYELREIDKATNGNKELFMELYQKRIYSVLEKEHEMVHKWWWNNK